MRLLLVISLALGGVAGLSAAGAATLEEAQQAYQAQHWEEAARILQQLTLDEDGAILLALALYRQQDFDAALPRIQEALQTAPDHLDLNRAQAEILIADRQWDQARNAIGKLQDLGAADEAAFHLARIDAAEGNIRSAEAGYRRLLTAADPALAQRAGAELVEMLQVAGNHRQAYRYAAQSSARDPDSFLSHRFEKIRPGSTEPARPLRYGYGYRVEYDDNVALLPDNFFVFGNTDDDDIRHVLHGDLIYRKPLGQHFSFFAEGHLSQSIHHDNSRFNLTRASAVAGVGQSWQRWGWRLPLEYRHDRFDGDAFSSTAVVTPGIYLKLAGELFLHFYGRYEDHDFDQVITTFDDRSGDTEAYGVLLSGRISPRWGLRSFVEHNDIDTDGSNWVREELRAYAFADYQLSPAWRIGFGARYVDADFDNLIVPFIQSRDDEGWDYYASINYRFRNQWRVRAQLTVVDHDSTLPLYEYDRNVLSFGISRDF